MNLRWCIVLESMYLCLPQKIQEGEKIEENKLFPDPFFKLAIFYNRR
jgi:hypothetical protein